jgi:hypothetical protein
VSSGVPDPVVTSVAATAFLLTGASVLAGALGAWRFGADHGWTNSFFITDGLFSHYQLWFAAATGAQMTAVLLKRWAAVHTSVWIRPVCRAMDVAAAHTTAEFVRKAELE